MPHKTNRIPELQIPRWKIDLAVKLMELGLTSKVAGEHLGLHAKMVKKIRRYHGQHVDRSHTWPGPPGTGDFATCEFCGVNGRMPCTRCVIRAMRAEEGEDYGDI